MAYTFLEFPNGEVITSEHPEFHKDATRLTRAEGKRKREAYCRRKLREMLAPGDRVYTILRHVSASGMSRRIDLYTLEVDKETGKASPRYLSAYAADLIGWKLSDKGGIEVSGCGMDMGFHLVYSLGACIWPEGTSAPHGTRNGEPDTAGGYALKQEWL